jgi:hypothetical protein
MSTYTERHLFSKLPDAAKQAIVDEVVEWGLTIWHSTTAALRGICVDPKAFKTVVYQLRTDDATLVGVASMKFYRVRHDEQDIVVVRTALGLDPKHRGNKFALRCLLGELLRWKASNPLTETYLFSTLIHPVTYKLCCDLLTDKVYPYFKNPDNPPMRKMITELAELFGVEKSDSPHPFVYRERFVTIETEQVSAYWRNNQRPEVKFYVEHCPQYHNTNDCLIGLAHLSLTHVVSHMLRTLSRNWINKVRGRKVTFPELAQRTKTVSALVERNTTVV